MAQLSLRGLYKSFGTTEVLQDVNLDIADREFVVFVGPSGCGKSTLLRMIAGLEEVSAGTVTIGEREVTHLEPADREVAMVFQSYALYPHMSVFDNMAFGLKMGGIPAPERAERVEKAARVLQIEELLQRRPRQLSGGQRQRVAIGRAIVREPKVFLFDEPLSNLDAALRVQMRVEIAKLHNQLDVTMIYVTHDQVEAMTMADKIVVLNKGRVEQVGTPLELYRRPYNLFVAGFIGSPKMNFLETTVSAVSDTGVTVGLPGGSGLTLPVQANGTAIGDPLTLGTRPEHLREDGEGDARLPGEVFLVEHLGGETFCYVRLADDSTLLVKGDGESPTAVGDRLDIGIASGVTHLFGTGGQALEHLA